MTNTINLASIGRSNAPAKDLEVVNVKEIFGFYKVNAFDFFTPAGSNKEYVILNYEKDGKPGHVSIGISAKIADDVADGTPQQRLANLATNYPDIYVSRTKMDGTVLPVPALTFSRKGVLTSTSIPFTSLAALIEEGNAAAAKAMASGK